jgi:hypothetical protein
LNPEIDSDSLNSLSKPPLFLTLSILVFSERIGREFSEMTKRSFFSKPPDDVYVECQIQLSRLMEKIAREFDRNSRLRFRFWGNVVVDNAPWDASRLSG